MRANDFRKLMMAVVVLGLLAIPAHALADVEIYKQR